MKKRKFFLIFFSLIFSLTYCLKVYAESLTEEKIKNFTYWLTFEETLVKLKDGKYEAGNKPEDFIKVYIDRFSIQDLDVDGRNEAVAILFSNYGGLVSFYELTALLSKADGFYQTDSIVAAELGGMTEDNVKSDAKTKTKYSFLANDLGLLILRELKLEKHKISIRVNSNGCTDKKTIKANVKKTDGVDRDVSHYEIHFIRTQPDYCKAIFPEGVVIEYDLKGDFGIDTKLPYTVSIKNPVYPLLPDEPYFYFLPKKEEKPKPVIKEESKLKENLIKATINAIEREKERYEKASIRIKNKKLSF
ncbi:MAG: hypothetical protein RMI01_07445 [Thermodesulfovibrio sp.]|nr:hypothetical protein [Thermodesulfovibrio sp.]